MSISSTLTGSVVPKSLDLQTASLTPIIQHAIFSSCRTVIVWVTVRALGRQDVVRDILIVALLGSRFREFKIADDPLQLQRDNKWVGNRSSVSFWIVIE
jgi:hypothetical protein